MGTACLGFLRCVCGKLAVLRAFPPEHMGNYSNGGVIQGRPLIRMARRGYEQRHQSPAAMNEQAEEEEEEEEEDDDPKAKPWRS